MNQVLVFNGKAVQVEDDILKRFPIHSALSWVEDPSGLVKAGWSYDGINFTPPPPAPVNPALVAADATFAANQGQGVGVMPLPQLSKIVEAMAQKMGLVDENGDII